MAGNINVTFKDYTGEKSSTRIPTIQIDAANLAQFLTDFGAYKTALGNITLGVMHKELVSIYDTVLSNAVPASPFAQRELKLFCTYEGNTSGDQWNFTIPAPDLSALTFAAGADGNSDFVVVTDGGVMEAFKTAFETIARDHDDVEDVTLVSVQVVGRNV